MTDLEFYVDGFMVYCTSKGLSKKTMASYEQTMKLFCKYLEGEFKIVEASKVKTNHIRHYIKYLKERGKYTVVADERECRYVKPENRKDYKKEISMSTIANYIRNIKVFFNWLYSVEKEIDKNPVEKIEQIKVERKMKKTLEREEIKRIFRSFDVTKFHGYRNLIITKLLFDTGMRVGECLGVKVEDIDFKHKSIIVRNTKSKIQRYVYFGTKMKSDLRDWLKYCDRYVESELLFSTKNGGQLSIHVYEKVLRDVGKEVGIEVHPHQLRNNFAKYYVLNGGDWFTLSRILGHSSVEVTQKAYLDFTDEEVGRKYQLHSPLSVM